MMGSGDDGLLKVGRRRPKSGKQPEAGLAILRKILSIAVGAVRGIGPRGLAAVASVPAPAGRRRASSGVINLSEPDIQTA